MRSIPLVVLLAALAVVPAVFEEFFFRGYLLTAVRKQLSGPQAIVATAALFGLFHVVVRDGFAFERLLPTMTMGLVLGWVCLRTGSLFPGILLHSIHNGLLLTIGYYERELTEYGIGVEEKTHLPLTWLAGAAVIAVAGFLLMRFATPAEEKE